MPPLPRGSRHPTAIRPYVGSHTHTLRPSPIKENILNRKASPGPSRPRVDGARRPRRVHLVPPQPPHALPLLALRSTAQCWLDASTTTLAVDLELHSVAGTAHSSHFAQLLALLLWGQCRFAVCSVFFLSAFCEGRIFWQSGIRGCLASWQTHFGHRLPYKRALNREAGASVQKPIGL